MALYPYQNVTALYDLGSSTAPFVGLSSAPNDWTIGVSYATDAMGLGVSGIFSAAGTSSNIDIDTTGRVWFPSNKPGASGIGYFDPTTNSFSGPFGGDYLTQPQYVAVDTTGNVWATDQASDNLVAVDPTGAVLGSGYVDGTLGGPIAIDYDNTLFYANEDQAGATGNYIAELDPSRTSLTVVDNFVNTPTGMTAFYQDPNSDDRLLLAPTNGLSTPCNTEGDLEYMGAWTNQNFNTGTVSPCVSGGSASTAAGYDSIIAATSADQLCSVVLASCFAPTVPINLPEGVATDGLGSLWIANSGDGSVSTLYGSDDSGNTSNDYLASSPIAYTHNASNGGTMTAPYGLAIDGSGNVWVANAGCVTSSSTACTPTALTLSELIGAAAPTITPVSLQYGGNEAGTEPSATHSTNAKRRPSALALRSSSSTKAHVSARLKGEFSIR